mmetsp:Transcript_88118/g.234312  ORF Transcript_88118/g.234312 Transcript_88118/m.234312 type:complete len:240 (-) Transcript_88118:444-1163(-)
MRARRALSRRRGAGAVGRRRRVPIAPPRLLGLSVGGEAAEDQERAVDVGQGEGLGKHEEAQHDGPSLAKVADQHRHHAAVPRHNPHVEANGDVGDDRVGQQAQRALHAPQHEPGDALQLARAGPECRHDEEDVEVGEEGHLQRRGSLLEKGLLEVGKEGVGDHAGRLQRQPQRRGHLAVASHVREGEEDEADAHGHGGADFADGEGLVVDEEGDNHGWNQFAGSKHHLRRIIDIIQADC